MNMGRSPSRFGMTGVSGIRTHTSKGALLRQLEALVNEARKKAKAIAEGRTEFIGYILEFRNRVQYCLADIGGDAQEELHELAALDLSISEGLQQWYEKGVYNAFQVKDGDPTEFLRLQQEYDQATLPKIERMITLLNQVRDKMLGPSKPTLLRLFDTPPGSTWAAVLIRFTSDFQVQITVWNQIEVRNYIEMGFEDRRGKRQSKPDGNWQSLREFAARGGEIVSTREAADWPKLEKAVQTINKRLQKLFGFSSRSIIYDRTAKAYRTRFKILPPLDD